MKFHLHNSHPVKSFWSWVITQKRGLYVRQDRKKVKMHTFQDNPNIPAFLGKLWKMVNDPSTDHVISWSEVNV